MAARTQSVDEVRQPKKRLTDRRLGFYLIAPAFLLVFGVLGYPFIYSIYLTLVDLNTMRPWVGTEFVGAQNFIDMLGNQYFRAAIVRTFYFAGSSIITGIPIAFAFALLLNQRFPLRGVARAMLLVPWAIPGVVNGIIWIQIYDANHGALNGMLIQLGIIHDYIPWLTMPPVALPLVIVADVWQSTPALTLLLLAGLQTIPRDTYEAAEVDGASDWQAFRFITLPLLRPMALVVIVLKTISAFGIFDLVFLLTGGGPANATQVIGFYIYRETFRNLHYGFGAAMSYSVAIVILILVIIYAKLIKIEGTQEAM